jgi:hypothetical protein
MPKANQISLTLSADEVKFIHDALDLLESRVPFFQKLSTATYPGPTAL